MSRHKFISLLVAVAIAASATSVAIAATGNASSDPVPTPAATSAAVSNAFSVFARTPLTTDSLSREALKRAFAHSTPDEPFFRADFSRAEPAPISGSKALAWVFPAGDEVCIAIADPRGGFGASCASVAQAARGAGFVAIGDQDTQSVILAILTPDGSSTPTVGNADQATALSTNNNVAAAVLPPGVQVRSGDQTLDTATFLKKPDPVRTLG